MNDGEERREKPLCGQQPLNEVLRSTNDGSVGVGDFRTEFRLFLTVLVVFNPRALGGR